MQQKEQEAAAERTAAQRARQLQQVGLSHGVVLTGTAPCYSDVDGESRMELAERIFEDLVSVQQQAQQAWDEYIPGREAHLMHPEVEDAELRSAGIAAAYSGVVAAALQGQAIMLRYVPPTRQDEVDAAAWGRGDR